MAPDNFRRYIDAGILLGQVTRARAEELVRDMIDAGEVQRDQAQDWVEDVVDKSRKTTETLLTTVKNEVESQLSLLGLGSLDDLAKRVADVLMNSGSPARHPEPPDPEPVIDARARPVPGATSRSSSPPVRATARRGATAKRATSKTSSKKSPAKKAAAKSTRAPAKKAPAKKAAAKSTRAPAKKTPARRVGPAQGRPGGRTS